MKLRIMVVFNTPTQKGNWSMVNSVTNKYELMVVPRKKKKDFVELTLLFKYEIRFCSNK